MIRKEKSNGNIKENKNTEKEIKEILSPKTKEVIKRNKSMENFMKFSWGWTN